VIREDPDREGLLYAGTEYGMFISIDNGRSWQPFQQNMPATVISDFKVYRQDLIIATQGRGFWIVDNLTPLHQIDDRVAAASAHLFAPRTAYRMSGNTAMIDFSLQQAPTGPVKLEILAGDGSVIRSFESAAPAAAATGQGVRGGQAGQAGQGGQADMPGAEGFRARMAAAPQFKAEQGLNRFEWDMRVDGAGRGGPAVPPGRYTLRLTAPGAQPMTAPLTVALDPRLEADGITAADLQAQYELSQKVAQLAADVQRLQTDIRSARQRAEQANDNAALERVRVIEAQVVNAPTAYPQQMLAAQVNFLNGIIGRGDNRPHRDAFERHDELRAEVDRLSRELAAGR
jgi:hypothetical protein